MKIGDERYHRRMPMLSSSPELLAAKLFRGFADPVRVGILLTLLDGERRVRDLVEAVGGSQSNVSGHLACLKECGLVVDRPADRRQVYYRLSGPEIADLLRAAEKVLAATGRAVELCRDPLRKGGRSNG